MISLNRKKRRQVRAASWLIWVAASAVILLTLQQQEYISATASTLGLVLALVIAHLWMWQPGGVPVLMYHSVSAQSDWLPWAAETSVCPKTFECHLATLQRMGQRVIHARELIAARQSKTTLANDVVVITLDDGYLDNWVAAFPLLKRYNMPATIFVCTDFIEPGSQVRPNLDDLAAGRCSAEDIQWQGYLNWAELQLMQQSGLIDIESHGTDHARITTGPQVIGSITPHNWRDLAWLQWGAMLGNKADWYRASQPPQLAYGTLVYEHQPALAAHAWQEGKVEDEDAYKQRVRRTFQTARDELTRQMNKEIQLFCWPFEISTPTAHALALETGFRATTGGMGENRPNEEPTVISRIPINDRALGWSWPWAESLALRANVQLFQGRYYWYLLLLPMQGCRRLIHYWRKRLRLSQ